MILYYGNILLYDKPKNECQNKLKNNRYKNNLVITRAIKGSSRENFIMSWGYNHFVRKGTATKLFSSTK